MAKQRLVDKLSCATGIVALILGGVWLVRYLLQPPGTIDFHLHKARYERIISTAKALGIPLGGYSHFWITRALEPVAPGHILKHNDMTGMVDVFRDDEGAYRVSIVTSDEGYYGTFGYLYADGQLTFPENTTGLTSVHRQLDSHWWTGYNGKW